MGRIQPGWEHFTHEADIGVCGWGGSPAEAFEQAALAMTAVITELASVSASRQYVIQCREDDLELLFVDWLNAIIYNMATEGMLFSRFQVEIQKDRLDARLWGEKIDVAKHQPVVEVKGATMTSLNVTQQDGIWRAQTVLDV